MTEKQLTEWVTAEAEESIIRNECLPGKVYPNDVCSAPTLASGG
jgi:D-xylose 1-dehydrogenase